MNPTKQALFSIFHSPLPSAHQLPCYIYQTLFLHESLHLLVIDTQKHYAVYRVNSQTSTTLKSKGKFQDQLADNFKQIIINGRSFIVYQVEDWLYLHDVMRNRKVDGVVFRENRFGCSVIYEEEYRFRLVRVLDSNSKQQEGLQIGSGEISYVILFWKTSAMYKTGNRELAVELKVLSIGMRVNEGVEQKLILLNQLSNSINPTNLPQPYIHFHSDYPKPIKIQSQAFVDFTFAFKHPISYQTQGFHLQLSFLSPLGQIKRKFTINSIYNQLIKEIMPVSTVKMLIITKHQSMNLEEMQQQQPVDNEGQGDQGINQGVQDETQIDELKNAEDELFREDFIVGSQKLTHKQITQRYKHIFDFGQSPQTPHNHFEQDQRIDIYSISLQKSSQQTSTQTQHPLNHPFPPVTNLTDLKLTKLYSSLPIKDISKSLPITPNLISNLTQDFMNNNLGLLDGSDACLKECNDLSKCKDSVYEMYYENLFTKKDAGCGENKSQREGLDEKCRQLFKVTYSKKTLYMNMLEELWRKTIPQKNTNDKQNLLNQNQLREKPQNQSQLNYNQTPTQNPYANSSNTHNPFLQTILSLLID